MSLPMANAGALIRDWRQRRRLSQLELASQTGTSTRHLSFLETGRSRPSRDMVLRLAEHLQVPVRDRNTLLLAAGHAPAYPAHALDDPEMEPVRSAVEVIVQGHEPYPALVLDANWNVIRANSAFMRLTRTANPLLLEAPMNVVRLALHPDGLAPAIVNLPDWQRHLVGRLRQHVAITGNARLADLLHEVQNYPPIDRPFSPARETVQPAELVMPLHLRLPTGPLKLFSTVASFGTPLDATVSELAIETFFPADEATKRALQAAAGQPN